jgi:hypothetical protein
MGFSFLGLLFLQLKYIQAMVDMKKEQFDESVNRALYQASRNLELNETLRYLEKDVNETERRAFRKDSIGTRSGQLDGSIQQSHQYSVAGKDGTVYSSFELKTITIKPSQMPKGMILSTDKNPLSEASKSLQEIVKNRYIYQKALLDEVVYSILYSASERPLKERIIRLQIDKYFIHPCMAQVIHNRFSLCHKWDVPQFFGKCFLFIDIDHSDSSNLKQFIAVMLDIFPHLWKIGPVCQYHDRILSSKPQIPQYMPFPENSCPITDYSIKDSGQKQCNTRKITRIFHKEQIKHGKQYHQADLTHGCRQFYEQSTFQNVLTCI